MNQNQPSRISEQLYKLQTDRKLIAVYDRLRYVPLTSYAQIHAKGEYQETLFLPLRIGERAWISTHTHTFMTTAVERILEVSGNCIVFETRNTRYNLKYENVPNEIEVMCA